MVAEIVIALGSFGFAVRFVQLSARDRLTGWDQVVMLAAAICLAGNGAMALYRIGEAVG